ncbi:MAG: TIGR03619 family F420-dependent LLM class oxidoreductase [Chloroflexi bacterium]|nr:TIGR03619 family F420-dependent LLM class oxidoreductase [Chloroflexota bacterium]
MEFGISRVQAGPFGQPDVLLALAQAAEALEFESFWLGDHICFPARIESRYPFGPWPTDPTQPYLEPLSTASFLLGRTARLAIGVNTLVAPYRNPLVAAKTLATMDFLSEGRVRLALGTGWLAEEFPVVGAPPFEARGKILEEVIQIFRRAWTDDLPSFEGRFFSFPPTYVRPRPHRDRSIPMLVGGWSNAAVRRAAQLGDGWSAPRISPTDVAEGVRQLRQLAAVVDRDPASLEVNASHSLEFHEVPLPEVDRLPLTGTVDQVVAGVRAFRAAGATRLLLSPARTTADEIIADLTRFREEVLPALDEQEPPGTTPGQGQPRPGTKGWSFT